MSTVVDTSSRASGHLHHSYQTHPRQLVVLAVETLTADITHFVFGDPAGRVLTSYEPGSHLIIQAGGKRNAYSLVGDGVNPRHYGISVLRHGTGGGSQWLHANLGVGSTVLVEGPRSLFSPDPAARKVLLVAAGIGVTPVLSHARAAARWGRAAEAIYIYRSGAAAHLDDLRILAAEGHLDLHEAVGKQAGIELLRQRLHLQPLGTHAYACGPVDMLETYGAEGLRAGWPSNRLHVERFEAPKQDAGSAFRVKIASTGEFLSVGPGVSLLQKLLDAGHNVANLCRQGVCGECRIAVRSGTIEHRDLVLSEEEKSTNTTMLCCVSRGEEIEVDI
ncbi:PDR/VanB family oxidoreductase [Arthrobacter globiformis]|uniref:Oxidoreductase n=1 Tax=Arthrobacter globiformis TaxID=1665 RepID=A0A328HGY4_ARTGO|nr:PDR/VanB family oxidoreductase [Arthrobacter globiformis]RAM37752.1 oxidoreductase [Arthrobacter globiformis]